MNPLVKTPRPLDEPDRLLELRELQILDRESTPGLEALVDLVSESFNVPIALVSLLDSDRYWFMASRGLNITETSRDVAFCRYALFSHDPLVVEDARQDPRFADNPLVLGEPFVRFYAGAPLVMPSGRILGTLCITDHQPRSLSPAEIARLKRFAATARELIAGLSPGVERTMPAEGTNHLFLARLAHDLKTPIGSIMGFAELMQHEVHGPLGAEEYQHFVNMVRKGGTHAIELVDSILAVERAGIRSVQDPKRINLTRLVRTVARSFDAQIDDRGQKLVVDAPGDDITCEADSLAAHRILNNLISNACKYAGTGSTIRISVRGGEPDSHFRFDVSDDGPGIPKPVLERIGEPFVEGGSDTGSGLGLSNVVKLAASMGCTCDIANTESGGAHVAIYKPSS